MWYIYPLISLLRIKFCLILENNKPINYKIIDEYPILRHYLADWTIDFPMH